MAANTLVPVTLPAHQIYLQVPTEVCRRLVISRKIVLPIGVPLEELIHEELAVLLHEEDAKDPTWLINIVQRQIINIVTLNDNQLYVYGAYYGLHFEQPWSYNTGKLVACAVIQMLLNPQQSYVQQLLIGDNRTILIPAAEYYLRHNSQYLPSAILGEVVINRGQLQGHSLQAYYTYHNRFLLLTTYGSPQFWHEIYQVPKKYNTDPISYIVRTKAPLPFENYLIQAQQGTLTRMDAYTVLGMIIPPTISDADHVQYIQDNVIHYLSVLKHKGTRLLPLSEWKEMTTEAIIPMLGSQPDVDLFNTSQAYIPYRNRVHLLDRLSMLRNTANFFLPLSLNNATNKETIMATPVTELPLDHSVAVVFGTLTSYHVYEVDDLIHAFSAELNGATGPRRPEATGNHSMRDDDQLYFNLSHLQQLNDLLTVMQITTDTTTLKQLVNKHCHGLLSALHPNDTFLTTISKIDTTTIDQLVKIFQSLITTAMYMRRWPGPGNRYPLDKIHPGVPEPTVIISERLMDLKRMINVPEVWSVFHTIPMVGINSARDQLVPISHSRFMERFGAVVDNVYCIKLASSDFIYTAAYYLGLLGRGELVNFNPLDVVMRGE